MNRLKAAIAIQAALGILTALLGQRGVASAQATVSQSQASQASPSQPFEYVVEAPTPAAAKLEAYATAVARGAGVTLIGTDPWSRFDDAKRIVIEDRKGLVAGLEMTPADPQGRRLQVKGLWTPNADIHRDPRALRVLLDAMGNPGVMVLSLEANMGRQVFRAASDTLVKQVLLRFGYTVQAAPQRYLDRIEELKKSVEFRRAAGLEVSVNQAFGSSVVTKVDQEYMVAWRDLVLGQGDDARTFNAAASVGAAFVVIGDCYTQEVPFPAAARAWADQGYRQARAYLNLQAMSTGSKTMLAAGVADATQMDFTLEAAGNKAITAAVQKAAEGFAFDMAAQLRSKELAPAGR